MHIKRHHILAFLVFYALCLLIQVFGSYFTALSVSTWYPTLEKSPLNPPGYVFGIVWTILYILMAVAATRVFAITSTVKCRPLVWWAAQLLLGFIWCIVFFGQQGIFAGFIIISCTVLAAIVTAVLFWRVERLAGVLMMPLILWLTLATHLNLYLYLHN